MAWAWLNCFICHTHHSNSQVSPSMHKISWDQNFFLLFFFKNTCQDQELRRVYAVSDLFNSVQCVRFTTAKFSYNIYSMIGCHLQRWIHFDMKYKFSFIFTKLTNNLSINFFKVEELWKAAFEIIHTAFRTISFLRKACP